MKTLPGICTWGAFLVLWNCCTFSLLIKNQGVVSSRPYKDEYASLHRKLHKLVVIVEYASAIF